MSSNLEEYGIQSEGIAATARRRRSQTAAATDRLPPNAPEMELGTLSCVLLAPNDCLPACIERFRGKTDVFYDLRHQTIYGVLCEMHEKEEAIDILLLGQRLKDKGVLEQVGGYGYVSALPDVSPSAANLSYYMDRVWETYLLRQAIHVCTDAVARVYDCNGDVEKLLDEVEADISKLTETRSVASTEEHIKIPLRRVITELDENSYRRGSMQLRGLPTGPAGNYCDKVIRGVRPKYYVVLAGRPGSGKTSLGMNWVEYWACEHLWWMECPEVEAAEAQKIGIPVYQNEQTKTWHRQRKGIPVVVFSIEMDSDSLTERLLFGRAGVDSATFYQGFGEKQETTMAKLTAAQVDLMKAPIYVDSSPGQTIGQIAAKARRMVKQYGLKNPPKDVPPLVFVLDYIQLVEQEGGNGMDRQKELTKISRKIMSLKKQLGCPWIVLAQMNRNIETAERDRQPVLSDLKDCGALEQDCDVAVFTYKTPRKELERQPENGGPSQEEIIDRVVNKPGEEWDWSVVPYRVDLVIPKNRFGPTGHAQMMFCKNLCRFEDFHLWKAQHGVESLHAGESKRLIDDTDVKAAQSHFEKGSDA